MTLLFKFISDPIFVIYNYYSIWSVSGQHDFWINNNTKQQGAGVATKDYKEMNQSEKKNRDWMNNKWRPMMGWMYMAVCITDFIIFPALWSIIQAVHGGQVWNQWNPITLQGAGLFHLSMGAILGITAYGRTQEKINGVNNSVTYETVNRNRPAEYNRPEEYNRPVEPDRPPR